MADLTLYSTNLIIDIYSLKRELDYAGISNIKEIVPGPSTKYGANTAVVFINGLTPTQETTAQGIIDSHVSSKVTDKVIITSGLQINEDIEVRGEGTSYTTEEVKIYDDYVTLKSNNDTGAGDSIDSGIEVMRGDPTLHGKARVVWDQSVGKWKLGVADTDGTNDHLSEIATYPVRPEIDLVHSNCVVFTGSTGDTLEVDEDFTFGILEAETEFKLTLPTSSTIFFQDNGIIQSHDENHEIRFERSLNVLKFKEAGDIEFYTSVDFNTLDLGILVIKTNDDGSIEFNENKVNIATSGKLSIYDNAGFDCSGNANIEGPNSHALISNGDIILGPNLADPNSYGGIWVKGKHHGYSTPDVYSLIAEYGVLLKNGLTITEGVVKIKDGGTPEREINIAYGDATFEGGGVYIKGRGRFYDETVSDWITSHYYDVNDLCKYENQIYICLTAHTSTTFLSDISNWSNISCGLIVETKSKFKDGFVVTSGLIEIHTDYGEAGDKNINISNGNITLEDGNISTKGLTNTGTFLHKSGSFDIHTDYGEAGDKKTSFTYGEIILNDLFKFTIDGSTLKLQKWNGSSWDDKDSWT